MSDLLHKCRALGMSYSWSFRCSPDSSDSMLTSVEQEDTEFCAEPWKHSLALLRQERVCGREQATGRQDQSYTRNGRRNKNLTLRTKHEDSKGI